MFPIQHKIFTRSKNGSSLFVEHRQSPDEQVHRRVSCSNPGVHAGDR